MYLSKDLAISLKKKGLPQSGHGRWYCIEGANSNDDTLYDHQDIADLNSSMDGLEFIYAPMFEELFKLLPSQTTMCMQKGVNGTVRFLHPNLEDHEYMVSPVDSLGMYIKILIKKGIVTF